MKPLDKVILTRYFPPSAFLALRKKLLITQYGGWSNLLQWSIVALRKN